MLLIHGILQARILKSVAISFSRGSFQPRDQTRVSCISSLAHRFFTSGATKEAQRQNYILNGYVLHLIFFIIIFLHLTFLKAEDSCTSHV